MNLGLTGELAGISELVLQLRQCGNSKALAQGRALHARLKRTGSDTGTFLGNTLIQMYGRCGSVEDARAAFSRVREPSVYTGNIMITALVNNGRVREAKELFDWFPGRNIVSWNLMVGAYARSGHLLEAVEVWSRSPRHDLVSWNAMISAYARNGQLQMAKEMFDQVDGGMCSSCKPDSIIYHTMLVAFAHEGRVESAKSMFDRIPENDVLSWNALVQAYAMNGHLSEAELTLQRMPYWSVVSWTTLMTGYAQHTDIQSVVSTFMKMPERDSVAWNVMLSAFSHNGHLVSDSHLADANSVFQRMPVHDVVSWTILLTSFSQHGEVEKAKEVFDNMPERNLVSWNSMLRCYFHKELGQQTIHLFSTMDLEGFMPDKAAFCTTLEACSSLAALAEGRLLHSEASTCGFATDAVVGTSIINMYGKCGRVAEAKSVFDRIARRDVVTWTSMFGAYAHSGQAEAVLSLFPELELEGTGSDGISLLCVLAACTHTGRVNDGRSYFRSMTVDYGLPPTVDHYVCMADLLGRGGELEKAEDLIMNMPFEADVVTWVTFMVACRIHSDVVRAERAAERVFEMDPEMSAGPYVQLLNILDAAGEHDEFVKVKRVMEGHVSTKL